MSPPGPSRTTTDRDGNYSLYSRAAAAENYLRGVQVTDAAGTVRYTSIVPARNVFRDGWTSQLGTITGGVDSGLAVALAVPVSA